MFKLFTVFSQSAFRLAALLVLVSAAFPQTILAQSAPTGAGERIAALEEAKTALEAMDYGRAAILLQSVVEENPEDVEALELRAQALMGQGELRLADQIYGRLISLTLSRPGEAVRFAFARWHIRQGYEAQAAMIRLLKAGELPVGNATLVRETLDDAYDDQGVMQAVRAENASPDQAEAVRNLEAFWTEACSNILRMENGKNHDELDRYRASLFGDGPIRVYHAVWRGFARIDAGDLDGGEYHLNYALQAGPDEQTEVDIVAGLVLLRQLRRTGFSNDLLNRITGAFSGVSSSVGERLSDSYLSADERIRQLEQNVRDGNFSAARETLAALRMENLDDDRKGKYLNLLAEVQWGRGEYHRANQGFIAAAVMLRDRFFLSGSLFRVAEYAAMRGDRELAADYVERSVAALPDADWRLRQAGDFLISLDMGDRAIGYFQRALDASTTLASDALAYSELADAYNRMGDRPRYLQRARDYVDTVKELGRNATPEQRGQSAFYQAEILTAAGREDEAFHSLEQASGLITDKYRLAEVYVNMAAYREARGEIEAAADLAEDSLALLPDADWKLRQIGGMMLRFNRPEKGIAYLERAVENAASLDGKAASLAELADAYRRFGEGEKADRSVREYIAFVRAHMDALGNEELGVAEFYQGELYAAQGDSNAAYAAYERAAELVADRFRRSAALMAMAEEQMRRGNRSQAAVLAEESAALLPDQAWKLRQAGEFFVGLDMPDRALAFLRSFIEATAPADTTSVYAIMADAYRRYGNQERFIEYARMYVAAVSASGATPSPADEGLVAFYQAEIHSALGQPDQAYQAYEQAVSVLADTNRLSDAYLKMAEYRANRGDDEGAAALARQAGDALPEAYRRQREVGDLLLRLGMPDEAYVYFERSVKLTSSEADRAAVYATMADTYKDLGNRERYLHFAREYIGATSATSVRPPSPAVQGLAAFYLGEVRLSEDEPEEAYAAYERASRLLTDKYKLADAFMRMAEYQAKRGERDKAADLAARSADVLPEIGWKQREVGDFLVRLEMPAQAFAYFERSARLTSSEVDRVAVYSTMAETYKRMGAQGQYLHFAREYIDAITADGRVPTPAEQGLASYYQGEIHEAGGDSEQAYAAYRHAVSLLRDRFVLSDAYMKMAAHQARRGDKDGAGLDAEKAAELLPDQPWLLRAVAHLFIDLERPEEALRYFASAEKLENSPGGQAGIYREIAEAYKKLGNMEMYHRYAGRYVTAVAETEGGPTREDEGLSFYYQAEILAGRNDLDQAYAAYEQASRLVTESFRLSDIFMKMAEYQAGRGNRDEAVAYAERSVALLPNQGWKLLQVAGLMDRLGESEKALAYFEDYLEFADTPGEKAQAYTAFAELYKKMGDLDESRRSMRDYIDIVATPGHAASAEERGVSHLYQGELYAAEDKPDEANAEYEKAAGLLTDRFRLSHVYVEMARYQLDRGDAEKAVEYAERSLAEVPDQSWRLVEVGDLYSRMEMNDRAIELYERSIELVPAMGNRASAYTGLAEVYKKLGDMERYLHYADLYIDAVAARGEGVSDNEKALTLFYRGDIQWSALDEDGAFRSWEEAFRLTTDDFRRSDLSLKMAEYHARQGNTAQAAVMAEQSAEILPDQAWRQRSVGDLFANLRMGERAVHYYERYLALSKTPQAQAVAYSVLADYYKGVKQPEKYIAFAHEYVAAVKSLGDAATDGEKGLYGYYWGEILTAEGNLPGAYKAYEYASIHIEDTYRLSEVYLTMARYNAEYGSHVLAATQACTAADLLPDALWRVGDAVQVLGKVCHFDQAEAITLRAVAMKPKENAPLYRTLANAFREAKNRRAYRKYMAMFIDHLTAEASTKGDVANAPRELQDELWDARSGYRDSFKDWSLDSYLFGRKMKSGDYYLMTSHELMYYFNLPMKMRGKFTLSMFGTIKALYSGYYVWNNDLHPWESRPRLNDSTRVALGLSVYPWSWEHKWLDSLSFTAEQVFGVGRDEQDDFRFRMTYDKESGHQPKPYGNFWPYWKLYSNTIYSTRLDDFTSAGETRAGLTMVHPRDRNFLTMPFAGINYSYGGRFVSKGERWGAEIGLGVVFKKYFWTSKYHTARANVEINLHYYWGMTKGRQDGVGFTLTTSF